MPINQNILNTFVLKDIVMKIPPFLQKGDTVAMVCTARSFMSDEAQEAVALFNLWGLQIVFGATIDVNVNQLGGTDEQRTNDLQRMMDDPNIKAIWIARGGYGTVRIIDRLDFSTFLRQPKWIIGFSDITVLHSHIHNLGVATLHAIMPYSVPKALDTAKETLQKALFGEAYDFKFAADSSNKTGVSEGLLVGGNLSIIYSLLGSPSAIDTKGKILFLEDLDEYLYHIDRMFYNLKRNGCLENLNGLIIGGMTDMHDNQIPFGYDVKQIILAVCKEYQFPICFNFPAGHIPDNRALKLGSKVELQVTAEHVQLTYK